MSKNKITFKEAIVSYGFIVIGAFIVAAGFVLFINPYKIVPGGVYGIGIVVHYITKGLISFWPEGIPIGLVGLSLDIPLIIIGMRLLGARFGVRTILGSFLMSTFMMMLTYFIGEHDPLGLQDDVLLSCIFGGLTVGLGLGLIFRSKATSGGSDIIAMILAKYTKFPVGQLLILVDSTIVLIGLAIFQDWRIPLYSWIVIYITGKVIDLVVEGVNFEKSVFIISDNPEAIRHKIIYDLNRGGTYIEGQGMYNGKPRKIIHTVMSRREVSLLLDHVRTIDPNAFITVTDASEILGEGFKPLDEPHTL